MAGRNQDSPSSIQELEDTLRDLTEQEDALGHEIEQLDAELTQIEHDLSEIWKEMGDPDCPIDRKMELVAQQDTLGALRIKTNEQREKLLDDKQKLGERHLISAQQLDDIRGNAEKHSSAGSLVGSLLAAPGKAMVSASARTVKDALQHANPLDKRINMNDTADQGIESLRLAYRTGKKAVNTARSTVGTARSTVKAAKGTVRAVKNAPRVIANTAKNTVRIAAKAVEITASVITQTIAVLINPITWIILFFCLVIYVIMSMVVLFMGAAGVQDGTHAMSYSQQVGITDEELDEARDYYRLACERNKGNFGSLIDNLYYSDSDRKNSDLVYMECSVLGAVTRYTRGYPTTNYKSTLKSAWTISVPEADAIAIAYVYLQMQKNAANGTNQQIYQIDYTQDIFNEIVDKAVMWSDTSYANQACTENNCSEHHDSHPNPNYATAQDAYNRCVLRRDDFNAMVVPKANTYSNLLSQYNNASTAPERTAIQGALNNAYEALVEAFGNWESVFGYTGWDIDEDVGINGSAWLQQFTDGAWNTLQNTPQTITTTYWECDHQHTLHSIGLFTYDKDSVMNALGFTDDDKSWESLIEQGMIWNSTGGA